MRITPLKIAVSLLLISAVAVGGLWVMVLFTDFFNPSEDGGDALSETPDPPQESAAPAASPPRVNASILGTWVYIKGGDGEVSFHRDRTVVWEDGSGSAGMYAVEDDRLTVTTEGEDVVYQFEIDGDDLTLTLDGAAMFLVRKEAEPNPADDPDEPGLEPEPEDNAVEPEISP